MVDENARQQLVTANRVLANEGIYRNETGLGHVSVRDPETNEMLISVSRSPGIVREEDIIRMDLDGEVLSETDAEPYLETVIHRKIYQNRDDVNAVVHHHAPQIMPFATSDTEFKVVFHDAALFHGGVPKFDDYDPEHGKLIVTEAEAERMAQNLGDSRAQLLVNHGANVTGSDLKEAILSTVFFVLNAEYQYSAELLGSPITYDGPKESIRSMIDDSILVPIVIDRMWEYLTSRLPK